MGRNNSQQQSQSSNRRSGGRFERVRPRKYAQLGVEEIDYKDMATMRRFLSDRGKIRGRRVTGLSRRHQRQLAVAVKRAREIAVLPFVDEG